MKPLRVVIADDHALVRAGLRALLSHRDDQSEEREDRDVGNAFDDTHEGGTPSRGGNVARSGHLSIWDRKVRAARQ